MRVRKQARINAMNHAFAVQQSGPRRAKLAVLIVAYGNPTEISRCLESLARSDWDDFEVFICENAGEQAFTQLGAVVTDYEGPLVRLNDSREELDQPGGRLTAVMKYKLRSRDNIVRLANARENLGYGGGVNAWLERFIEHAGWDGVLVLNPDTEVDSRCLSSLMAKASEGYGMIGSTLVFDNMPDRIINYGLIWSRFTGRITAPGRNAPVGSEPSPKMLAKLDSISGACMLVSRHFIKEVGLMSEDYFLYIEDLDWGRRRGRQTIGFASGAIVRHVCGTSIGSAVDPTQRSRLSIYLTARNSILYARRWAPWLWVFHFAGGLLYAVKYVVHGYPSGAQVTLVGLIDGARGKTGRPDGDRYA
jgi:N-acetylglucosaminyl-diphospho-decaprenol L-rhamnosyltransferase